ncbi:MAG: alpha-ketoglutarate-dependent dioxygenase AlkB [Mesorhizobium sp.]|nr:MAG: alpha-ketoglutarate-dependent dioxygenase AlkB [Mesorhizobium sp.]
MLVLPNGVRHMPGYLARPVQEALVEEIRRVVQAAPLYVPAMPRTDKERGYRYQPTHPVTGEPWPPIPEALLQLWREVSGYPHPPEACLVNFYTADAKMGLHQDRDEKDFAAPVVSVSLGDDCLFRVGQTTREGGTKSFRLRSGDVVVLGGEGRLAFHGVDRIYPATSALLKNGGRINLTLRRVTVPAEPVQPAGGGSGLT